jgi:FkbM family methyltransferase
MSEILPSTSTFQKYIEVISETIGNENVLTIFEFGSRYGEDTVEFAKKFPNATIYAFECNPSTFDKCKELTSQYKNIILSKTALSNITGKVKFYPIDPDKTVTTWSDGNQGASSLLTASEKYPIESYVQNEIEVDCIRMDEFMKKNSIQNIDVIWMDVQGAELMVLQGTGEKIVDTKIIHLEVEFFEIYRNQPLMKDILSFFKKNNFIFLGYTDFSEFSGDAIFLNSNLELNKNIIKKIKRKSLKIKDEGLISKLKRYVGL